MEESNCAQQQYIHAIAMSAPNSQHQHAFSIPPPMVHLQQIQTGPKHHRSNLTQKSIARERSAAHLGADGQEERRRGQPRPK